MSIDRCSMVVDPLAQFRHALVRSDTGQPMPLTGTRIEVRIHGGLAVVSTTRHFNNAEAVSIEATLTLPVPVHATLLRLEARIGGRLLQGRAQRRNLARATYEEALDDGRSAVLHEEVLRGIHMISVAHIPPGEEVEVKGTWALPLFVTDPTGATACLRIPTTVGAIYGRSPLPDSDDLRHGAPIQEAELTVHSDQGAADLVGHPLVEGRARVRLDAPIDLRVSGWRPGELHGRAADGRFVRLAIELPAERADQKLDAAVLVDRSGSMAAPASSHRRGQTKHEVLLQGLREAAKSLRPEDRIDLWQFSDEVQQIDAGRYADAIGHLDPPDGGTAIGWALDRVLAARATADVLLVTDGKSHALDVQAMARSGRRFHVVLIGEDSLEAHVGHLAALTGGQVFVATDLSTDEAVVRAFDAMRRPRLLAPAIDGAPATVDVLQGGVHLHARWDRQEADEPDAELSRAVAALAASLALPRLDAENATALAEAEGIVCHLTSLVLVDEAGARQEGIPTQRKIATMTPAASMSPHISMSLPPANDPAFFIHFRRDPTIPPRTSKRRKRKNRPDLRRAQSVFRHKVDWDTEREALLQGDLAALPSDVQEDIKDAAGHPAILDLARRLDVPPEAVVIAFIAERMPRDPYGPNGFESVVFGDLPEADLAAGRAALVLW